MIEDAERLVDGTTIRSDVCVVGCGPAGMTLGRTLAASGLSTVILESGGVEPEAASQVLARAENGGLPYFPLHENRRRGFGGTTHLWSGWCRPLDAHDFERRAWVADSGWPFGLETLAPYYARALPLLGLSTEGFELDRWESRVQARRLPLAGEHFVTQVYRLTDPTYLRRASRDAFRGASNVTTLLHANVTDIETTENGAEVRELAVRTLGGKSFRAQARVFVLAAGAIEVARLMLASDAVKPAGVGNDYDLVGRYFMEHMVFDYGVVALDQPDAVPAALYFQGNDAGVIGRLFPTETAQADARMLQACTQLIPLYRSSPVAVATKPLRKVKAWTTGSRFISMATPAESATVAMARQSGTANVLANGTAAPRPTAGVLRAVRLMHITEQAPNPDSRVVLGDTRDALGNRAARLEWKMRPIDRHTVERVRTMTGAALQSAGIGRFRRHRDDDPEAWPPPPLQGLRGHHMGTTRMHADPRRGVVDADCRVHGVGNLYVASSSVFPTSGAGIPTTTIVALAIRLADQLRRRLSG